MWAFIWSFGLEGRDAVLSFLAAVGEPSNEVRAGRDFLHRVKALGEEVVQSEVTAWLACPECVEVAGDDYHEDSGATERSGT